MGERTKISWTDHTWNGWIGCDKVSAGCQNCYAEYNVEIFPMAKGKDAFKTLWRTKTWGDPVKWNRTAAAAGRRELVFTCSMSDFFHSAADPWRDAAWALIKSTPNLTYQILTKRPERIKANLPADWGPEGYPNVWLGTSVELQVYAEKRIPILLEVPAAVHWLSCEPLLGPLNLQAIGGDRYDFNALNGAVFGPGNHNYANRIRWVVVGGESGSGWRPMEYSWALGIFAQCVKAGVAFWGKQRAGPVNELPLFIEGHERKQFPAAWKPAREHAALVEGAAP
jgi:protein gp37